ncbi:hypothetical protein DdX_11850 [Ditylenchus destructor]|uniref:Uncharacterized protein n=1 Tax=Ditylenchus destructor TaxID=166010 RepID=A0AAD4MZZ7_9BILA|nr:hypothetical protein DdX_11850 [Ditylenchus destructor]
MREKVSLLAILWIVCFGIAENEEYVPCTAYCQEDITDLMRYTIIIEAKKGIKKVCEIDKKLCDEACSSYQKEASTVFEQFEIIRKWLDTFSYKKSAFCIIFKRHASDESAVREDERSTLYGTPNVPVRQRLM